MSASTERKNRQAARQAGTDKKMLAAQEAEKKARKSKRKWTIGTIAVLVCIALVLVLSSPLPYRVLTAETIGSKNYSPAEVNYFIGNTKLNTNYQLYLTYFGQEAADQVLQENLNTNLLQNAALLQYAQDEGISLNAREKSAVAEVVSRQADEIADAARNYGVSTATYMNYLFGAGVNQSVIRSGMEDSALANKAYFSKFCSLSFSQEELDAYTAGLEEDGDLFSYAFYRVDVNEERSDAEAKAAAEELANSFSDNYDGSDDALTVFNDILAEEFPDASATTRTGVTIGSADEILRAWLSFPARAAGDTTVTKLPDNTGYYVVLFLGRDDNSATVVQVRHILVKAVADEDGNYSDEAKAEAKAKAEEILAAWEAGGKTEAEFASLAYLCSEDSGSSYNGGLYSQVRQGQMVEEFDAFCFADHQPGDTAIVYGESGSYAGYHVMYYVGSSSARDANARDALAGEAMSAWISELTEGLEPVYHWAYKLVG